MSKHNKKQEREMKQLVIDITKSIINYRTQPSKRDFVRIYLHLCSLLPGLSDQSLSEIDDLIMPDNTQPIVTSKSTNFGEWMEPLINASLYLYSRVTFEYYDFGSISTLILLIAQSDEESYELGDVTLRYALVLIKSRNIMNVCLALKMITVAFKKHKDFLNKYWMGKRDDSKCVVQWIMKLKSIPQAKCPKKQRIVSWICRQSEIILDYLDASFLPLKDKFSAGKQLDHESYICKLMTENLDPNLPKMDQILPIMDHLYIYFMAASNENERLKLIESFVKGCVEAHKKRDWLGKNLPEDIKFFGFVKELVRRTVGYVIYWTRDITTEKDWNEIEKYHGHHFEPYLTDNNNSDGVQNTNCQLRNSVSLEDDEEPDFTIEKHLYYDDFIKYIQVLNILHTAFLRSADILGMERFPEYYELLIFRNHHSFVSYCDQFILDPYKACRTPVNAPPWIETLLKLCPFTLLSRHDEYLKEDLLKMLKHEEVDQATTEEIYSALNSVTEHGL